MNVQEEIHQTIQQLSGICQVYVEDDDICLLNIVQPEDGDIIQVRACLPQGYTLVPNNNNELYESLHTLLLQHCKGYKQSFHAQLFQRLNS